MALLCHISLQSTCHPPAIYLSHPCNPPVTSLQSTCHHPAIHLQSPLYNLPFTTLNSTCHLPTISLELAFNLPVTY